MTPEEIQAILQKIQSADDAQIMAFAQQLTAAGHQPPPPEIMGQLGQAALPPGQQNGLLPGAPASVFSPPQAQASAAPPPPPPSVFNPPSLSQVPPTPNQDNDAQLAAAPPLSATVGPDADSAQNDAGGAAPQAQTPADNSAIFAAFAQQMAQQQAQAQAERELAVKAITAANVGGAKLAPQTVGGTPLPGNLNLGSILAGRR